MCAARWIVTGALPPVIAAALIALAIPRPLHAQGFNAVTSKDAITVWAVGDAGAVYRSTDGGTVWESYPTGAADHNGVAAKGSRVWIVDDGGAVWRSTDGGDTFSSTSPAGATDLNAIWFADAATGWIAGNGGTILATTDSGDTWAAQSTGSVADLNAVRFASATDGWACGAGGTLLHTTNGGVSWSASTPFAPFAKALYDVDFDGASLYVCGTYGFLGKSTDGGANWTSVDLWIDSRSDVNGVEAVPGGALWLCGGGGFLRKSTDGAVSWSFAQHPIVTGMTDVFFLDASNGWACAGTSKNVARTTDGGATWSVPGGGGSSLSWTRYALNGGSNIRGDTFEIDPVNRDKLYAVQGITIMASWDRGDSWAPYDTIPAGLSTPRTNSFYVSPADTNSYVAALQTNTIDAIWRTTNRGVSWDTTKVTPFTEYGMPLEQDPNDGNVLYFGPEDGTVWKSTNFGATWDSLSHPAFRSPCDLVVVARSPNTLFCGDGVTNSGQGQVFRSTNAGVDWSLIYTNPPGSTEIPTIASSWIDNTLAYATNWSFGGVNRTTDMGATWPSVATTNSAWGVDVARDDPTVAMYGIYSGGTNFLSTDGAASFSTSTITGSNYGILAYDRGTYLAHQSNGLWKATVTQPDMPINNMQLVTVLSPNGAETWQYNEARSITWSSQNIASVSIEYQTSPAGAWQSVAASTPGAAGSYPWIVPNAPAAEARIRVRDVFDGAPVDSSDAAFEIVVPSIASVPASLAFGGVAVFSSTTDTIRIVNSGTATLVVSSVTAANGGPFTPSRTSFSIPAGASDTIAVTFTPGAILAYADSLRIASNAPATPIDVPLSGTGLDAGSIALASPDGGEEWQYNTVHNVTWSSNQVNNVKVEYETSGSGPWNLIAASVPALPASFAWTLPDSATSSARVRVTDVDVPGRTDLSAAPFSITVQTLAASPATVNFGTIPNYWTDKDTVRVSNPGTGPLTILSIASDSAAFFPSRTSFVVPAGGSDTIAVFFTPTEERTYNGLLTIVSNAPSPNATVILVGTATSPVGVASDGGALPARFELRGSYPNPFGASGVSIAYALPKEAVVSLVVYDAAGRTVATLVRGRIGPGLHVVGFPGDALGSARPPRELPSGVYFYRMTAGEFTETKRMILVR